MRPNEAYYSHFARFPMYVCMYPSSQKLLDVVSSSIPQINHSFPGSDMGYIKIVMTSSITSPNAPTNNNNCDHRELITVSSPDFLCMYVCMYVCMFVCLCVYMYVCMHPSSSQKFLIVESSSIPPINHSVPGSNMCYIKNWWCHRCHHQTRFYKLRENYSNYRLHFRLRRIFITWR